MSVALLKAILAYKRKTSSVEDFPWNLTFTFGTEDKICRICCEKGEIPIFGRKQKSDDNIARNINVCSDLTVASSDGLPKYLCDSCYKLLQRAMMFRDMCSRSLEKLRNLKVKQSEIYVPLEPKLELKYDIRMDQTTHSAPQRCICGQVFPIKSDYYEHISTCRRKKRRYQSKRVPVTYLCDICGKKSRSPAQHAIHATIHTNNFPYHCEHCPYRGRHKNMLVMHLKSHLAVKPFMCESCPMTFASTSNLKRHRTAVHQPEPVQCPHCNNIYSSKKRLKSHMENMHSSGTPMECDLCQKTFKSRKSLRQHRLGVHHVTLPKHSGRLPDYLLHELGLPKYEHIGPGKISRNLRQYESNCEVKPFQTSNETVCEASDEVICAPEHFEPTDEIACGAERFAASKEFVCEAEQFVCAPKHFKSTDELVCRAEGFETNHDMV